MYIKICRIFYHIKHVLFLITTYKCKNYMQFTKLHTKNKRKEENINKKKRKIQNTQKAQSKNDWNCKAKKNNFKENETAFCVCYIYIVSMLFIKKKWTKNSISKRYAFLDIHFFIFIPDINIYEEIILFHKSFHFHVYWHKHM